MDLDVLPTPNGVYRTPGRVIAPERVARPSLRTLFAPLGLATAAVAAVAVSIALFAAVGPHLFGTVASSTERFIPSVEWTQDALAFLLPGSLLYLAVLVARRVRPSWRGMRRRGRVLYVAALVAAQCAAIVAGEALIFTSRGGLHLFEPTHLSSRWLPDGRTAHLYTRGGLRCGYDVFVSAPLSFTATRTFGVSRATCLEPVPRIHVNPDGSLDLVDAADKPLEEEASPSFSFGGGC